MKWITAYYANFTGSDADWYLRHQELKAIFQQRGGGTAFFTFIFANYYWEDLHRLIPGGLVEPNRRYRHVAKNPHLVDWYFSARLDDFSMFSTS